MKIRTKVILISYLFSLLSVSLLTIIIALFFRNVEIFRQYVDFNFCVLVSFIILGLLLTFSINWIYKLGKAKSRSGISKMEIKLDCCRYSIKKYYFGAIVFGAIIFFGVVAFQGILKTPVNAFLSGAIMWTGILVTAIIPNAYLSGYYSNN